MSRYTAHHTLTPYRRAVLQAIANDEGPAVQRIQLKWFFGQGLLVAGSPAPNGRRNVALTGKAWEALGIAAPSGGWERSVRLQDYGSVPLAHAVSTPVLVRCADLEEFADGEMTATRAGAFRAHLAGCVKCQDGLIKHQQLSARISTMEPK